MTDIPYIQLDQFLKLMNLVSSGGEAKHIIRQGDVAVNGEIEVRRGRKLRAGDRVDFLGESFEVSEEHITRNG
jgi:ribosome-associated protein